MTTAAADPYGAIIGGTAFVGRVPAEIDANINPTCNTTQGTCDPATIWANPGFRFGAAFGTTLDDGAIEFEAMFTRITLREFQVPPGPVTPVNTAGGPSRANQITLMANLLLNMPGSGPEFYLGFGAGAARVGLNIPDGALGPDGVTDAAWAPAVQAFLGINFATNGGAMVGLRYRMTGNLTPYHFTDNGLSPVRVLSHIVHGLELVLTFGR
jgi:hypothetical protein